MKFKNILLLTILSFTFLAANAQLPYDVSPTGLRYKIHKDAKGKNAQIGDIVEFHLINRAANDSVLFSTYDAKPVNMPVNPPNYRGDLMDGMTMLSAGDSATIWIAVDSIPDFPLMPGLISKGDYLRYTIKVLGVYTQMEFALKEKLAETEQLKKDTLAIKAYFKANKIKNYKRTASGLYYVIDKKGPDANTKPKKGQNVKVHYVGTLLNGQKFDSSRDRNDPFSFGLGLGQVIPGWDEGIALLSKGTRGRLFIPSNLGYGAQGAGHDIPPHAVLIFDVELIDF